jgi:hypothetical protein
MRRRSSALTAFSFAAIRVFAVMRQTVKVPVLNRKIHRVYLIVLPLFVADQIAISQISNTEWWMHCAKSILF